MRHITPSWSNVNADEGGGLKFTHVDVIPGPVVGIGGLPQNQNNCIYSSNCVGINSTFDSSLRRDRTRQQSLVSVEDSAPRREAGPVGPDRVD